MKNIIFLSLLISLSGCATSYQKMGYTGGYSEMIVGDAVYAVSFSGNGYTREDRVEKLLLRRCAELTLEKGYDYFVIISDSNSQLIVTTKHDKTKTIKMLKQGEQPNTAMNAKLILSNFEN